ncbi:hypothetical protein D3C75_1282740 [compost metagenome]
MLILVPVESSMMVTGSPTIKSVMAGLDLLGITIPTAVPKFKVKYCSPIFSVMVLASGDTCAIVPW